MPCQIIINNMPITFEAKSLTIRIARKLLDALNLAYMHSMSIKCAPYAPIEQTDKARYITACQLVHDNLCDVTDGQDVRNICLERLRA